MKILIEESALDSLKRMVEELQARNNELESALKRLINKGSGCQWKDWESALIALHGVKQKKSEDLSFERAIVATTFIPKVRS